MASQDELKQVGLGVSVVEPVAKDTPMQEDIPTQPNPEVVLGVVWAAHERPPRAISPTDQIMEMLAQMQNRMDANMQQMENKMDANMQAMKRKMDASAQSMERKMDEGRGEMQCMGLNLQAGIKGIMAPARGETTESRRSMEVCRPAMETGKAGTTRDATIIDGETCGMGHEGTMYGLKEVTGTQKIKETKEETAEMKSQELTEMINEVTETQKSKEGDELYETKWEIDEHTQVEIVRDNGVELVECVGTQCEHRINLPQERGETVCSLEADCDQVGPVGPYEVEWVSGANECTRSFGDMEIPEPLEVTRIPDVNVPNCVVECEWCGIVETGEQYECHSMRECMHGDGSQTNPDGRHEWRAWKAAKG